MGGACGTYGGEERCIQGFGGEILCKMTAWNKLAWMRILKYFYNFTMQIIRTYLYMTCNKEILFVKKYLSLLWVFTDFSILLVAFLTRTLR